MSKVLYVQASPRGKDSKSTQIADAYLNALRERQPAVEIETLNVWEERLPAFDGDKVAAKMRIIGGNTLDGAEKSEWEEILEICARFIAADHYVFAVPMWNSGVPYPLKHYIDLVHQPGQLWRIEPEAGYIGLLRNKRATLIMTAGAYAPHFPSPNFGIDYASTHLRAWLTQAGVEHIDEIRFDANLFTEDPQGALTNVKQAAVALAQSHRAPRQKD